jgi:predicted nicotinamide N-methyase
MKNQHMLKRADITFFIEQDDGSRFLPGLDAPKGQVTGTWREGIEGEIAGRVWPAGEALADYLDFLVHRKDPLLCEDRELRVLELGSGAGIAGIAASALFSWFESQKDIGDRPRSCTVIVSDLPNAIPLLEANCELNRPSNTAVTLHSVALPWGYPLPATIVNKLPFDLVLIADCVYFPYLHPLLIRTCLDLSEGPQNATVFLIAYRERTISAEDPFFEEFGKYFVLEHVEEAWLKEFEVVRRQRGDEGKLFLFRATRAAEGTNANGADQFEAMKLLSIDLDGP